MFTFWILLSLGSEVVRDLSWWTLKQLFGYTKHLLITQESELSMVRRRLEQLDERVHEMEAVMVSMEMAHTSKQVLYLHDCERQ
jgi:hypothetical protein